MCHSEVPSEPLLLPEQVAADHPLEGPPLGVVVAEAVLQVRLLHPRQAQRDLGVLSGDALKWQNHLSSLVLHFGVKFDQSLPNLHHIKD